MKEVDENGYASIKVRQMDGCLFGNSIVIVASVEDAHCILESAVGSINPLSADHTLDNNEKEKERVSACSSEVGQLNNDGGVFSLSVLIYQPYIIIICHLRLLRLICDSIIPIRRYALFQPAVIFHVQTSAILEAKREDICKNEIESFKKNLDGGS
nr:probable protein phosphatase 2C 12 [Tanacetum cinerariifolium]